MFLFLRSNCLIEWIQLSYKRLLYHFELFGMACDPWPPRRKFTSADANGTRDIGEFRHVKISARWNFGHYFGPMHCHGWPTPMWHATTDQFRRRQEGLWPVTAEQFEMVQYSTLVLLNSHFVSFRKRSFSRSRAKTCFVFAVRVVSSGAKRKMSSI